MGDRDAEGDGVFFEFSGQGLETFERAMDRGEQLLAVLGSRLLEGQKKVGEMAQAIEW